MEQVEDVARGLMWLAHMGALRSEYEFRDPYSFPSFHTRIQAPYNYYEFGQRYVRNLINFEKSVRASLPWLRPPQCC